MHSDIKKLLKIKDSCRRLLELTVNIEGRLSKEGGKDSLESTLRERELYYPELLKRSSEIRSACAKLYETCKEQDMNLRDELYYGEIPDISAYREDDKLVLVFPGTPPGRIRYHSSSFREQDLNLLKDARGFYYAAVAKIMKEEEFKCSPFKGKVLLHVKIFSSKKRDPDNYDIKYLVDAVATYCLIDDSQVNVSYLVEVETAKTGEEKTVVSVIPIEKGIAFVYE